jgi:hypothetical protein
MCVLVRDSTASALVPQPNIYTLTVSDRTEISINNGEQQYLSGNYTISVGSTQFSVLIAGGVSQAGQTNPYQATNGSTIAIKYSMLRRTIEHVNYKKSGLIKYVPVAGNNPNSGNWTMIDIDTQPLDDFSGDLPFSRITGNIPTDRIYGILPAHTSWFGVVKMSTRVGVDVNSITVSDTIMTNDAVFCSIGPTTSSQGVWWLNLTLRTVERADTAIVILH